jgi:hypothetical protein
MERLEKGSDVGEYQSYHFTAAQAETQIDSNTHGVFMGKFICGTVGTSPVITISNGPSATSSNIIAVFKPTQWGYVDVGVACDRGLYVTITGSGFDITITALDMIV